MNRKTVIIAVQTAAAAAAIGGVYLTVIFHVMRTMSSTVYDLQRIGLAAIAVVTVAVLVSLRFRPLPAWIYAVAAALTLVAGFAGLAADRYRERAKVEAAHAANRAYVAQFIADLDARKKDIEARIAAGRPYTPEQALEFLTVVTSSNLSSRNDRDRSPEALAMLQRAVDGKVIDPNGVIPDVRSGAVAEPLFLHFYKQIRRGPNQWVSTLNWRAMKVIAKGADLTRPEAAPLAADLGKTEILRHFDAMTELQ